MKKLLQCLCLLMALILPLTAFAAVRMPAQRGTVTDDANVLSTQTIHDVNDYATLLADETGVGLHVAVVHFLDGLDAQTYADRLFEKWSLSSDDLLLLAAAGEDTCATSMGKDVSEKLGKANAENLMYTSSAFASLLRTQQYDAAFNAYFTALNALVEKQTGSTIRMGSLFGSEPVPETTVSFGSQLWSEVMDALEDSGEELREDLERHEKEDNGMTAGSWIVLIVLFVIIMKQSRKSRHSRRFDRRGCGCSPLGWIIGLLGLGWLFNRD